MFSVNRSKGKVPNCSLYNFYATSLIKAFKNVFAQYGLLDRVITDNRPPFMSTNVKNYFKSKRVYHQKITPRWPRATGKVEKFMRPLSKIIKAAYIEKTDWENSVH